MNADTAAIIVMLARLYDVQLALYAEIAGSEKASKIKALHAQGKLWSPPPVLDADSSFIEGAD